MTGVSIFCEESGSANGEDSEDDVCPLTDSAHRDVKLAVGENGHRQVDADSSEGLSLGFIDRHRNGRKSIAPDKIENSIEVETLVKCSKCSSTTRSSSLSDTFTTGVKNSKMSRMKEIDGEVIAMIAETRNSIGIKKASTAACIKEEAPAWSDEAYT